MVKEFEKCPYCRSSNLITFMEDSQQKYKCKNCEITFWSSGERICATGKGLPPLPMPG